MSDSPLRRPRPSRSRFDDYRDERQRAHHREKIHDVVDREEEKKRARGPRRSFGQLLRRFVGVLAGHRLTIGLSLATLTGAVCFGLMMPYSSKVAIDYILTDNPGPEGLPWDLGERSASRLLWILGGVMLAVTLCQVSLGIWGRWQCTRITKRVQVSLRKRVFDHASRLPLHRIHAIKSGGVASVLREDAGGVGELVFSLIYNPWRAVVQFTGTLIVLAIIDWKLLVGAVALVPLVWVSHKTWIARIRPMFRDIRQTRQVIDAQSAETFGGMRVVRAFARRHAEANRFTREGHFMARQELYTWWWSRLLEIAWEILIPLASVAVLVYGGSAVLDGALTIGDLMAFSAYLLFLLGPLESLVASATNVQTNLAALDRVIDLLDESPEFDDQREREVVTREEIRGRVTLEHVRFAYPTRADKARSDVVGSESDNGAAPASETSDATTYVIDGVSLEVEAGETIAFVGPSGAGKTTLCNLIARFYDASSGRLLVDGRDLTTIDVESYRRLLGIVEQDVFLFDGTVAENIGYARRDATMDEIMGAARAANAHGFITELERGYATLIGERGVRLSGGQKQRLAIARAILANPRILILDEATSSLDTESERLIQKSLGDLMRGRTSFVIAHRLSTIRHADRIVVIEQGRIIEQGTHDELLASGGRYADVLRMQLEGEDGTLEGALGG